MTATHPDFGAIEIVKREWRAPVVTEITGRAHLGAQARAIPGVQVKPGRVRAKAECFETFRDGEFWAKPARYAKGMMKVGCPSPNSFITRAGRLAAVISNERYSGRENAWIMSPAAAARFVKLYDDGADACRFTGTIEPRA